MMSPCLWILALVCGTHVALRPPKFQLPPSLPTPVASAPILIMALPPVQAGDANGAVDLVPVHRVSITAFFHVQSGSPRLHHCRSRVLDGWFDVIHSLLLGHLVSLNKA
ncbi:uncharacterized protein BDZ83DRAFT_87639 [Colletotrichum acutatum]|uniref:Secreted protein n=1 Tax=Glomerella acutata TaxID=27357 RepID=A0AAD9D003_GLOAC|nr:uncharacterized protein BDZ83DRAFT_87639 [Colletotrichum acutatum]KAK1728936.1 hypothetical protein BDZ83DRAFT_87639 [Colletotrichum acutatum]